MALGAQVWNPQRRMAPYRPQTNPHLAGAPNLGTIRPQKTAARPLAGGLKPGLAGSTPTQPAAPAQKMDVPSFSGNRPLTPQQPIPPDGRLNVGSQIQPSPLIPAQQTNQAANSLLSSGIRNAISAGRQTGAGSGFAGSSAGMQAQRGVAAAQSLGEAYGQAQAQRQQDAAANAQNMLAGQTARAQDWLGQMGNMNNFAGMNQQYADQNAAGMVDALGQMGNLIGGQAQDTLAMNAQNAQNMLAGQNARAQDWLSQMGNVTNFAGMNQQYAQGNQGAMLDSIQSMGNLFGGQAQDALGMNAFNAGHSLDQLNNLGAFRSRRNPLMAALGRGGR